MTEPIISPEDQMMRWITTKWITKPIYVVTALGIADLMTDGPKSVDELAKKTKTHGPTLFRLLRALSAVGVFVETEARVFGLTPLAECLSSHALGPLVRLFFSEWHDRAWDGLSHTVRTGESGFDHSLGRPSFEWLEEHPTERAVLDQGQAIKVAGFAGGVIDAYDFGGVRSICDIGGGQGTFFIKLAARYPNLTGYVADLPGAVPSARRAIANAGMEERIKAIPYDFHQGPPPPVCDGYFLVNILHDWRDEICTRILKNIADVMKTDSTLWIVEYILDSEPGFNVAKLLDLEVLVMSGGCERSREAYQSLVNEAGLKMAEIIPTKQGPAVMVCKIFTEKKRLVFA